MSSKPCNKLVLYLHMCSFRPYSFRVAGGGGSSFLLLCFLFVILFTQPIQLFLFRNPHFKYLQSTATSFCSLSLDTPLCLPSPSPSFQEASTVQDWVPSTILVCSFLKPPVIVTIITFKTENYNCLYFPSLLETKPLSQHALFVHLSGPSFQTRTNTQHLIQGRAKFPIHSLTGPTQLASLLSYKQNLLLLYSITHHTHPGGLSLSLAESNPPPHSDS